jgi:hypothetical protein
MINTDYWLKIQQTIDTNRWIEQAQAKFDIIDKLFSSLDISPRTILLTSFNPIIILLESHYDCIVIADQSLKYSWQSNSRFVDSIKDIKEKVDVCLALDEYFTYAETEQNQRDLLENIKAVTNGYVVTTLQDYKNNAPHKRNQVETITTHGTTELIILDQNILDKNNRQNWKNYIYYIENHKDLTVLGPETRRTMYFKQLAKYSSDLNGSDYVIQRNLLYRGFFKKNYEHIITLRF